MSSFDEQLPLEPAQPVARSWPLSPEPEPVFGLVEAVLAFVGMFVAAFFFTSVAAVVAHRIPALRGLPLAQLVEDPRVFLPAQFASYLLLLAVLWRLFSHHLRVGFFRALHWEWPRRWPWFLASGVFLAIAVQMVARLLPIPPEAPIDKMLRSASDAWLMAIFGVLIAPFVEEVLFRGLLFPALARRAGAVISLLVTAFLFGAVHGQQLGGDWMEIAFIVFVGVVLTLVRWRTHSLASSTLVHVGYNFTLFLALFAETHGFTNFAVH